jgi:hypothetical protein
MILFYVQKARHMDGMYFPPKETDLCIEKVSYFIHNFAPTQVGQDNEILALLEYPRISILQVAKSDTTREIFLCSKDVSDPNRCRSNTPTNWISRNTSSRLCTDVYSDHTVSCDARRDRDRYMEQFSVYSLPRIGQPYMEYSCKEWMEYHIYSK